MYAIAALIGASLLLIADEVFGEEIILILIGAAIGVLWLRQTRLASHPEEPATDKPTTTQHDTPARTFPSPPKPAPGKPQPAIATHSATASSSPRQTTSARISALLQQWLKTAKGWLSGGNLPVKIGILVLFVGVAALLNYAYDNHLLSLPPALRVSGIAAAALVALVFGWRQRQQRRSFSLALQGGAIGVLLMVVFASLRLYQLLPAPAALLLMVLLVAGCGLLALLQDALPLALLGLLAGFAAPILTSSGHGSHVALFSYYAILNLAIFGIAWRRSWRLLNLLGFIATQVVAIAWGVLSYRPDYFASTEPFLILNFLIYLAIPWFYLRRHPVRDKAWMDASLLFGNPLICLLLQGSLLDWQAMPLAFSAISVALLYALAAWGMRHQASMSVLHRSWAVLALLFATLAVPLALDAKLSAGIFALEGAGLIWLGLRQQRPFSRWCGLLLQAIATLALLGSYADYNDSHLTTFIGALLLSLTTAASSWLYQRRHYATSQYTRAAAIVTCLWSLCLWLLGWGAESLQQLDDQTALAALWLLTGITAWGLSELARRSDSSPLEPVIVWASVVLTAFFLPCLLFCLLAGWQPLGGWLLLATLVTTLSGWRQLACLTSSPAAASSSQLLWWWRWALLLGVSLLVAVDDWLTLAVAWELLLLLLPGLALWFLLLRRAAWLAAPLPRHFATSRRWLLYSFALCGAYVWMGSLFAEGSVSPPIATYIPLLNPTDLLLLTCSFALALWLKEARNSWLARKRPLLLGLGAISLVSSMTLRGIHQLAGAPWGDAIFSSSLAQLSLTLVWSIFGVVAWLWGSRRQQRSVWLAGAVTMAVVLIKLLLIDRDSLGDLFGIASFIAYGILCVVIGYLAPAPPSRQDTTEASNEAG